MLFSNYWNSFYITGSTAGGSRNDVQRFATNPQFKVVLMDSDEDEDDLCTCIVSLMQKGSRGLSSSTESNRCLNIGIIFVWGQQPKDLVLTWVVVLL